MTERKIVVPEEMLQAFWAEYSGGKMGPESRARSIDGLAAAIRWVLTNIIHESNVECHRAILHREAERYPGFDTDSPTTQRRVDFEFGASFARQYIERFFTTPALPKEIKEACRQSFDGLSQMPIGQALSEWPRRIDEIALKAFLAGMYGPDQVP